MKRVVLILAVLVLAAFSAAQDDLKDFGTDASASRPARKAVEIRVLHEQNGINGWGGPYTDATIIEQLACMAEKLGLPIASSTEEILREASDSERLAGNPWVRQDTERTQRERLIPGEIIWEVRVGGQIGQPRQTSFGTQSAYVSVNSASATMWISLAVKDSTGVRTKTIRVERRDANTNINDLWALLPRHRGGQVVEFHSEQDGNIGYRHALVAADKALQGLDVELSHYYQPRQVARF